MGEGGRRIIMPQKLKLLFPTPLVKTNIGTDFDISNIEFQRSSSGWISVDQYYLDNNKKLKDSIEKEIEIYFRETLKVKKNVYLKHQTSWALLHKKGDFSPRHYHSNSWLSGVYYFKQLKNSGAVQFHAQRPYGWSCSSMNPIESLEEVNDITSGCYVINPIEGDLLLFPSQLDHSSFPNDTNEDRVAISFNYTLHGTWGANTGRITI